MNKFLYKLILGLFITTSLFFNYGVPVAHATSTAKVLVVGGGGGASQGGGGAGGYQYNASLAITSGSYTVTVGSGGGGAGSVGTSGSGGSGIVIISYTTSEFTHTGGDETGTNGSETWVKFTADGTLTLTAIPQTNIKTLNGLSYPTAVKSRNGILQSVINYINGIK